MSNMNNEAKKCQKLSRIATAIWKDDSSKLIAKVVKIQGIKPEMKNKIRFEKKLGSRVEKILTVDPR